MTLNIDNISWGGPFPPADTGHDPSEFLQLQAGGNILATGA
jgi:hypothetical protein